MVANGRAHQGHWRKLTIFNLALGQRCDVDLHSVPSVCAEAVVRVRDLKGYACLLAGTTGQPDADNNHVKRDGNNGRDLVARNNV